MKICPTCHTPIDPLSEDKQVVWVNPNKSEFFTGSDDKDGTPVHLVCLMTHGR